MTVLASSKRPRVSRGALPSTEGVGRDSSELVVIPGSMAYEHWLQLLNNGDISYAEFIDWTTPGRFPTRAGRLIEWLRTLRTGFTGIIWPR